MSETIKNKIFWWVFALSIVASVAFTYVRIFVNRDYILVKEVACDQNTEKCFVRTPEEACIDLTDEAETEDCLKNTETEYYKIINKKAANVPDCDTTKLAENESCPDLSCAPNEPINECWYEYSL